MMEFFVSGQSLKFFSPVIAADSLGYLTARVNFVGEDWEGYSKWLHFRRGDTVYDMQLDENNEISADRHLNLSLGHWEIYLTGVKEESRLTTVPVILTVKESGLIDAPLHELPMSVAEQLDFNARQALLLAQSVKDRADAGGFDGAPGTSFSPLGYFETEAELTEAVPEPLAGAVYGVGSAAPYDIYVWDGMHSLWVNNGPVQGARGEQGEAGATFIPALDANGNLSWTNDGGLENPALRNIMGPRGEKGEPGEAGEGAYEKAQQAGYTGTEATFYQALTAMPYHNARHLPQGADPLVMQTGNLEDGAVTGTKLAADAVCSCLRLELDTDFEGETAPYTKTLDIAGLTENSRVIADVELSEDYAAEEAEFAKIRRMSTGEGTLTLWADAPLSRAISIKLLLLHSGG